MTHENTNNHINNYVFPYTKQTNAKYLHISQHIANFGSKLALNSSSQTVTSTLKGVPLVFHKH
jgi:hypothetical protein